jgi:hypothetical protein
MRSDEQDIGQLVQFGYIKMDMSSRRGLEYTMPATRRLRKKTIDEARRLVLCNQKRCDEQKLAKMYGKRVKHSGKEAHEVGLQDAKAAESSVVVSTPMAEDSIRIQTPLTAKR